MDAIWNSFRRRERREGSAAERSDHAG
jgi:hypothetical protein